MASRLTSTANRADFDTIAAGVRLARVPMTWRPSAPSGQRGREERTRPRHGPSHPGMKLCNIRTMRWSVIVAVTAVLLTACGSDSEKAANGPPTLTTSPPATGAVVEDTDGLPLKPGDLTGTWRPRALFGRVVQRGGANGTGRLSVKFHGSSQRWVGYDGCNWTNGSFTLGGSGAFSAQAIVTTTRGCIPLRREGSGNVTAITQAHRVAVSGGRLRVYGASGQRIGVYVRTT